MLKYKIAVLLLLLSTTVATAEFIGKAEKSTIAVMAILTTYSTKCGDLTPFGNRLYLRIAKDQEDKGRLLWDMREFKDSLNKTNSFIKRYGLSKMCRGIKKTIKATPMLNKAIE